LLYRKTVGDCCQEEVVISDGFLLEPKEVRTPKTMGAEVIGTNGKTGKNARWAVRGGTSGNGVRSVTEYRRVKSFREL